MISLSSVSGRVGGSLTIMDLIIITTVSAIKYPQNDSILRQPSLQQYHHDNSIYTAVPSSRNGGIGKGITEENKTTKWASSLKW